MRDTLIKKDSFFIDGKGRLISIYEGLYLVETGKYKVAQNFRFQNFKDLFEALDDDIKKNYIVYKDLRKRNLKIGAGTKFGGVFRVYENENDIHSKWIVLPIDKEEKIYMHEFLSKNRVAHSTRKRLVLAILDKVSRNVTYLESRWVKL